LSGRPQSSPLTDERPVDREVTAELLARYDLPGPRYTSYPTAVEFDESITPDAYENLLAEASRLPEDPLSVYIHLPFCEERCLFCGCHVIATMRRERTLPYLDWLRQEIDLVAEHLSARRGIAQLHLGGGTPTYHQPEELDALLEYFFARFHPVEGAELAIEVDPRVTKVEHLEVLAARGFNRISVGVQDFTEQVQKTIGREQSLEETVGLIERARSLGFRGINVDLIYGLPHQDPASFERTVEQIIDIGIDRAAVYSFAYVPWIRGHQSQIPKEALPDRGVKFELYATARERFLSAGYEPIGMDHFAAPNDELTRARHEHRLRRNFQGYAVIPAPDVIGFGVSAIGDVRSAYVQNVKKLSEYQELIGAGRLPVARGVARSDDDELRRHVIHELMCNFRVDIAAVQDRFKIDFREYFAPDIEELRVHEAEGMVRLDGSSIEATAVGELFVRNLALCFDRYWRERHRDKDDRVFSRTV
jgi:oxygen-independent coproporphyrinogen-3 oxidase